MKVVWSLKWPAKSGRHSLMRAWLKNGMQILFKFQLVWLQGLKLKSSRKLSMYRFITFGLRWICGGPRKMFYMFYKVGFPWFRFWNNLEESIKENMSQIAWIEWSFPNWWLPHFWLIKEIGWRNLKQSFMIVKLPFLFIIIFYCWVVWFACQFRYFPYWPSIFRIKLRMF